MSGLQSIQEALVKLEDVPKMAAHPMGTHIHRRRRKAPMVQPPQQLERLL
jgi:hypothetical protein